MISFGIYDAILSNWKGEVVIVSTLGKQNTGKSFMFNLIYNTRFDISGGRCTDGIWLSCREINGVMHIILDFEGLGSLERSEQEDMLLSLFNAAVSSTTFFKTDSVMGRELLGTFDRMQRGISAILQGDSMTGENLFKGRLVFVIKDVEAANVNSMMNDYQQKLLKYVNAYKERSFIKRLFRDIKLYACSPFGHSSFFTDLRKVAAYQAPPLKINGPQAHQLLITILAKFRIRDWKSYDQQQALLIVNRLQKNVMHALRTGESKEHPQDPCLRLADGSTIADDGNLSIKDQGLDLSPVDDNAFKLWKQCTSPINNRFSELGKLIESMIQRRVSRVNRWISSVVDGYKLNADVKFEINNTEKVVKRFEDDWKLCGEKCSKCFLECARLVHVDNRHECYGDHKCTQNCEICDASCALETRHPSRHDCSKHKCSNECSVERCPNKCIKSLFHTDECHCMQDSHTCREPCTIKECAGICPETIDHSGDHTCSSSKCPFQCSMGKCRNSCSYPHGHHLNDPFHMCNEAHKCEDICNSPGNCHVEPSNNTIYSTQLKGSKQRIEVEMTLQNVIRFSCNITLQPYERTHTLPHKCQHNHKCSEKCPYCDYFCTLSQYHQGKHQTSHGHMKKAGFVFWEREDVVINERKYGSGDSAVAELCGVCCTSLGPGHVHLVDCKCETSTGILGVRHHNGTLEGKDEMTHFTFWNNFNWVDPNNENFELCGAQCSSNDHGEYNKSTCCLPLWHNPATKKENEDGWVSDRGHRFMCKHEDDKVSACHFIFVIDRSGSMNSSPLPTLEGLQKKPNMKNKLGCTVEACYRFALDRFTKMSHRDLLSVVAFDDQAKELAKHQRVRADELLSILEDLTPGGGTDFSKGLLQAKELLRDEIQNVIILLSDGENNSGKPIETCKEILSISKNTRIFTVFFGNEPSSKALQLLQQIADLTKGKYFHSKDFNTLTKHFYKIGEDAGGVALLEDD